MLVSMILIALFLKIEVNGQVLRNHKKNVDINIEKWNHADNEKGKETSQKIKVNDINKLASSPLGSININNDPKVQSDTNGTNGDHTYRESRMKLDSEPHLNKSQEHPSDIELKVDAGRAGRDDMQSLVFIYSLQRECCNGHLITNRHVLTSAFCVGEHYVGAYRNWSYISYSPDKLSLYFGRDKKIETLHYAIKICIHPDFMKNTHIAYRSIAVIVLRRKVIFGNKIKPISLARPITDGAIQEFKDIECTFRGYTQKDPDKLYLTVSDITLCQKDNTGFNPFVQMCTYNYDGFDTCSRDMWGSGLVCKGNLVAIFSYNGPCEKSLPIVFARVDNQHNFINYALHSSSGTFYPLSLMSLFLYFLILMVV